MSRKPKKTQNVVEEVQDVPVEPVFVDEPAHDVVKHSLGVNVDELKALLYKNDLEAIQEAASKVEGDELTMQAVKAILNAKGSGIASQYLQQIIQRNS